MYIVHISITPHATWSPLNLEIFFPSNRNSFLTCTLLRPLVEVDSICHKIPQLCLKCTCTSKARCFALLLAKIRDTREFISGFFSPALCCRVMSTVCDLRCINTSLPFTVSQSRRIEKAYMYIFVSIGIVGRAEFQRARNGFLITRAGSLPSGRNHAGICPLASLRSQYTIYMRTPGAAACIYTMKCAQRGVETRCARVSLRCTQPPLCSFLPLCRSSSSDMCARRAKKGVPQHKTPTRPRAVVLCMYISPLSQFRPVLCHSISIYFVMRLVNTVAFPRTHHIITQ